MIVEVAALVLLPVLMFGAAWALAAARQWLGANAMPRARSTARAIRVHQVRPRYHGHLRNALGQTRS